MAIKAVFWTLVVGVELLGFVFWGWWSILIINGGIIVLEFLLTDNLDNFLQESNLNVKKIPKLLIERKYEFQNSEEKINWKHDAELGWRLKPNTRLAMNIAIPELGLRHSLVYNTIENGSRRTSSASAESKKHCPVISILGCSNTYGHSLNDEETYAWLLQEQFPEKRVINYGVAGYSLYQCLLVLEKTIKEDGPEVVVIGFHPDLGWRNTSSFAWAHRINDTWRIPSCVSRKGKLHRYPPRGYVGLPYSGFRVAKSLELYMNRLLFWRRGQKAVIQKTMEHLLLQMRALCERHGAKLIVACLDESRMYYDFLNKNGFSWCVTGVDTNELTKDGRFRWILYPFDNHPNQDAHRRYAEVIGEAAGDVLAGRRCSIRPELLRGGGFETKDAGAYIYPIF
ncbi:MAG: hypothetical protein ABIJ96_13915 [Elusimicrobiota bacterium]